MGIKGEAPSVRVPTAWRERFVTVIASNVRDAGAQISREVGGRDTASEVALTRLELALVLRNLSDSLTHESVTEARQAGATWEAIATVTGHPSRGAAARHFAGVRVSESETPATP